MEKQLGRDRSQFGCNKPTYLETIEDALYVECGADFTLVMNTNFDVKAFGNSNYGQVCKMNNILF